MRAALELGRWTFPAPIGYLNAPKWSGKSLVPDPERAPLIARETTCGLLALDSLRPTAVAALSQCRASNPPLMGRADSWTTGPWHR
jgi:hypothetical protein